MYLCIAQQFFLKQCDFFHVILMTKCVYFAHTFGILMFFFGDFTMKIFLARGHICFLSSSRNFWMDSTTFNLLKFLFLFYDWINALASFFNLTPLEPFRTFCFLLNGNGFDRKFSTSHRAGGSARGRVATECHNIFHLDLHSVPETFEWILPLLDFTGNFTAFTNVPKYMLEIYAKYTIIHANIRKIYALGDNVCV